LIQIQASVHKDIDCCYSGDIAALVGVKDVRTGDTFCDESLEVLLEPPTFPEPVISMAVEPKTKGDQEKMGNALQRLSEEDPTFFVKTDEETGQTIIAGMGELHLEILCDRLKREHKVETNTGKPQIAYRETLTKEADGEGKLVKQSGGRGQYGHVVIKVRPGEKGKGVVVENKVVGGTIPKEFINPAKAAVSRRTQRHHRWLSSDRHAHRPRRWLQPRRRFQRKRLQDGRHLRRQRRAEESQVHSS
jgi:elongation factor G